MDLFLNEIIRAKSKQITQFQGFVKIDPRGLLLTKRYTSEQKLRKQKPETNSEIIKLKSMIKDKYINKTSNIFMREIRRKQAKISYDAKQNSNSPQRQQSATHLRQKSSENLYSHNNNNQSSTTCDYNTQLLQQSKNINSSNDIAQQYQQITDNRCYTSPLNKKCGSARNYNTIKFKMLLYNNNKNIEQAQSTYNILQQQTNSLQSLNCVKINNLNHGYETPEKQYNNRNKKKSQEYLYTQSDGFRLLTERKIMDEQKQHQQLTQNQSQKQLTQTTNKLNCQKQNQFVLTQNFQNHYNRMKELHNLTSISFQTNQQKKTQQFREKAKITQHQMQRSKSAENVIASSYYLNSFPNNSTTTNINNNNNCNSNIQAKFYYQNVQNGKIQQVVSEKDRKRLDNFFCDETINVIQVTRKYHTKLNDDIIESLKESLKRKTENNQIRNYFYNATQRVQCSSSDNHEPQNSSLDERQNLLAHQKKRPLSTARTNYTEKSSNLVDSCSQLITQTNNINKASNNTKYQNRPRIELLKTEKAVKLFQQIQNNKPIIDQCNSSILKEDQPILLQKYNYVKRKIKMQNTFIKKQKNKELGQFRNKIPKEYIDKNGNFLFSGNPFKKYTAKVAQRMRQKLRLYLVKLKFLNLQLDEITKKRIISQKPYQREGSYNYIQFAKNNNAEKVLQFLQYNRFYVYDFDELHQTSLHIACRNGNIQLVKILLNFHSDPDARDLGYRTPLFFAIKSGISEIVKEVLSCKASPWSFQSISYFKLEMNDEIRIAFNTSLAIHFLQCITNITEEAWQIFKHEEIPNVFNFD